MYHPLRTTFLIAFLLFQSLGAQSHFPNHFNTRGLDMELLSYGGSLGVFYSIHPDNDLSIDLETDWTLVESNDTFTYYDYYGRTFSINNRNLSMVKFVMGTTWFPFLESMHPSLQFGLYGGLGPLVALNTDDVEKFVERWKHVESDVTVLYRAGVHLRVLGGEGSAYNFRLGYDYSKFDKVIDERQSYHGLYFQAAWEFMHQ